MKEIEDHHKRNRLWNKGCVRARLGVLIPGAGVVGVAILQVPSGELYISGSPKPTEGIGQQPWCRACTAASSRVWLGANERSTGALSADLALCARALVVYGLVQTSAATERCPQTRRCELTVGSSVPWYGRAQHRVLTAVTKAGSHPLADLPAMRISRVRVCAIKGNARGTSQILLGKRGGPCKIWYSTSYVFSNILCTILRLFSLPCACATGQAGTGAPRSKTYAMRTRYSAPSSDR